MLAHRLSILLLTAGLVAAASPAAAPAPAPHITDATALIRAIHTINQAEINAGDLAAEKARGKAAREYGRMLARDHRSADLRLDKLAVARNVSYYPLDDTSRQLAETLHQSLERMRDATGRGFNKVFAQEMAQGHADAIALLQDAKTKVQDKELTAYVDQILPDLERHLQEAEHLGGKPAAAH